MRKARATGGGAPRKPLVSCVSLYTTASSCQLDVVEFTDRHSIHESALAAGRRSAGAAAAAAAASAADMEATNLSASVEVQVEVEVEIGAPQDRNLPALVFGVLLIVVIICGNLLVCLSVMTEKALKTTTNYFIVSLAVADLMLAVLVLPLFVYSEVGETVGESFYFYFFYPISD